MQRKQMVTICIPISRETTSLIFRITENFKWWDKCIDIDNSYDRQSKMLNVEITAYGLLTLLLAHEETKCMPILKWLLNERNSQGGFEGTQDTIVGIDALARLATKIASENNDVKIQLNASLANGNVDHIFVANATNRLLRQSETVNRNHINMIWANNSIH